MMKRTVRLPVGACFFDLDVFADKLDNIYPVFDGLRVSHTAVVYHSLAEISNLSTTPSLALQ